jgi:hypothetical protein
MSTPDNLDGLTWRVSSRSGSSGSCVETADLPDGGRAVRNSNDRQGPVVLFTAAEWAAFIAGVRAGEDL